jgi:hypothetical protein
MIVDKQHEPTAQFVSRLEWQLLSEIRRGNRLDPVIPQVNGGNWFRLVPISLLCFALGIAATMATQYLRTSPRAEYLVAKAESDLEIAQAKWDATRAVLEWFDSDAARQHPLYGDESVRRREVQIARERLEDARFDRELAHLALEEIRVTHQPLATELWAPTIDGRDFLSERLWVEVEKGRQRLSRLQGRDATVYFEDYSGEAPILSMEKEKIARLERSIDLRSRFLSGQLSRSEMVDLERLAEARDRLRRISTIMPVFQETYDSVRAQFKTGHTSPLAVANAEVDLRRMEALLGLTQKEIELLEEGVRVLERE